MKTGTLLLALSLVSASVPAAVYKWVDQDGTVHFGDKAPGGVPAETVTLPKAPQPPPPSPAGQAPVAGPSTALPFTGYARIAIIKPKDGGTVRSNQERVTVDVQLEPPLQPDHKLVLLVDHEALGVPTTNTRMVIQGIHRGLHSLQIKVVDAKGLELGKSSTVYFTLRHAALEAVSGDNGHGTGQSGGASYVPPPNQGQSYRPAANQGQAYKPPVPPVYKP